VTTIPMKDWFRPDELAVVMQEPISNVYRWLREGKIKHVHFGRKTKIPHDEVERILAAGFVYERDPQKVC
jgi:excisionase family DNA binding protein